MIDRREQNLEERRRDRNSNDWRDLKNPGERWMLLTKQQVNFCDDRDRINVGDLERRNGRFKELQIRVHGTPVEIRKMIVTLRMAKSSMRSTNVTGSMRLAHGRHRFSGGKRRDIQSIDIDYFSVENQRKDGRGTLYVCAR